MKIKSIYFAIPFILSIAVICLAQTATPPPSPISSTPPPGLPIPATVTITLTPAEQTALGYAVAKRDIERWAEYNSKLAALPKGTPAPGSTPVATPVPYKPSDPVKYLSHRVADILASYAQQAQADMINSSDTQALLKAASTLTPAQQAALKSQMAAALQAAGVSVATPVPSTPQP